MRHTFLCAALAAGLAIGGGIADSGLVLLPYSPATYPNSNLVAELSISLELEDASFEKSGLAYAGAMHV